MVVKIDVRTMEAPLVPRVAITAARQFYGVVASTWVMFVANPTTNCQSSPKTPTSESTVTEASVLATTMPLTIEHIRAWLVNSPWTGRAAIGQDRASFLNNTTRKNILAELVDGWRELNVESIKTLRILAPRSSGQTTKRETGLLTRRDSFPRLTCLHGDNSPQKDPIWTWSPWSGIRSCWGHASSAPACCFA